MTNNAIFQTNKLRKLRSGLTDFEKYGTNVETAEKQNFGVFWRSGSKTK